MMCNSVSGAQEFRIPVFADNREEGFARCQRHREFNEDVKRELKGVCECEFRGRSVK